MAEEDDDLDLVGDGFVMRGPGLMLFAAMLFAFAGWIVREQLTGNATCVHCHASYSLDPT